MTTSPQSACTKTPVAMKACLAFSSTHIDLRQTTGVSAKMLELSLLVDQSCRLAATLFPVSQRFRKDQRKTRVAVWPEGYLLNTLELPFATCLSFS
ncbi:hypothetical protein VNO77_03923 [Canavalia gladiata]|uniref:Uncharacterized protein n=1 Tax=Canavalia gladiata TaxID=3824 RepID=A0AAN9N223_CANGL